MIQALMLKKQINGISNNFVLRSPLKLARPVILAHENPVFAVLHALIDIAKEGLGQLLHLQEAYNALNRAKQILKM